MSKSLHHRTKRLRGWTRGKLFLADVRLSNRKADHGTIIGLSLPGDLTGS